VGKTINGRFSEDFLFKEMPTAYKRKNDERRRWKQGRFGSGAHPASCPMGTGGSFPGGKARPGRDADHSPPSSAEVENE
jgi:hypothetical protein